MKDKASQVAKFYRGLSPAARAGVWVLLMFEVVLIAATQRDIQRRPSSLIRGPKLLWRLVATQNVLGPAAYFGLGRRRRPSPAD